MLGAFAVGILLGRRTAPLSDEHPLRKRLLEAVRRLEGINEVCLRKELGAARATVRHHLRFLVDTGALAKVSIGRENHYFVAGTGRREMERIAWASHGRARKILREVLLEPGIPQHELAQKVGMTRKILRSYLDFLADKGLIVEKRGSKERWYYPGDPGDQAVWQRVLAMPPPSASGKPEDDCPPPLKLDRS